MATLEDLNRRIRSVNNTRKITRAMEMVAAAKLRRAQQRIETLRPFANGMVELTIRVVQGLRSTAPIPLLAEREVQTVAILMFTGDRGLAGPLNANIVRRSMQLQRDWEADGLNVEWIGVGKKGVGTLQFRGIKPARAYRGLTDAPKFRDAEAIARFVIEQYEQANFDRVVMVYNHFESAMSQEVIVQDLLPLRDERLREHLQHLAEMQAQAIAEGTTDELAHARPPGAWSADTSLSSTSKSAAFKVERHKEGHKHQADWFFEPDRATLLDRLLPTYIEQAIYRALLESTASEHGSRMTAMRNASENAAEMIDDLTLERNRARQAEITQEILEVVGGAEALTS